MDRAYKCHVRVKLPDGKSQVEVYTVSESNDRLGEAVATGKVVRYYESLKDSKQIKDYHILCK